MKRKAFLHSCIIAIGILAQATLTLSQEYSYQNAYISAVEGEVNVQRATEPDLEPGELNLPILPGDRVWTQAGSRVEVRYADGTILRLDERTKVDFVAFDSEPAILVWSGSVILKASSESARVRIDTPAGSVYPQASGTYRVDAKESTTTTLSVKEGVAELASSEGSVLVGAGQRSLIESGRRPEAPFAIDTARWDAFDEWNAARDRSLPRPRGVPLGDVPDEVHHYVDELSEYGDWREDDEYGSVWYPSVGVGWAPYRHGRWGYTHYGYTWISHEPWGWAPYHYGRWGYNHHGWYWIPGSFWGPAWVSFAIGPVWVGWSPLGYHGHPVFAYNSVHYGYYGNHGYYGRYGRTGNRFRGGKAVPRHVYEHGAGWNFVDARHFGSRSRHARLRPEDVRPTFARAEVHTTASVLDRSLTPHALDTTGKRAGVLRRPRAERRTENSSATSNRSRETGVARAERRNVSPSSSLRRAREIVGRSDSTSTFRRRSGGTTRLRSGGTTAAPTRLRSGGTTAAPTDSANRSTTTRTRERSRSTIFRTPPGASSRGSAARERTRPTRTAPQRTSPGRERARGSDRATSRTRTRGDAFFGSSSRRETVTRSPGRSSPRQRSTTRSTRTPTRRSSPSVNRSSPPRQRGTSNMRGTPNRARPSSGGSRGSSGVRGSRGRSQPSSGGSRGSRGDARSRSRSNNR